MNASSGGPPFLSVYDILMMDKLKPGADLIYTESGKLPRRVKFVEVLNDSDDNIMNTCVVLTEEGKYEHAGAKSELRWPGELPEKGRIVSRVTVTFDVPRREGRQKKIQGTDADVRDSVMDALEHADLQYDADSVKIDVGPPRLCEEKPDAGGQRPA